MTTIATYHRKRIAEIRRAVADFIGSEGCGCCEGRDHNAHQAVLGKLLRVPKYKDGSGYDFSKYRTPTDTTGHA